MTTAQIHEHAALTTETVREALSEVLDPEIQRPITDLGMVKEVSVEADGVVLVGIYLTVSGCPLREKITADATAAVSALPGVREVRIELDVMSDEQRTELRRSLRGDTDEPDIPFTRPGSLTRVYCVASGKGGVGKSSVTVNLAVAMASRGLSVGVLDADIHGHSVPRMLGVTAGPTRVEKMIMPPRANGVKVISVGMFTSDNAPVMWRGPLLHRALRQFLGEVYWGDLDVLLLDLPPGTGDIALSIAQLLPGSEILVVTTPQAAAAEVAERAGAMGLQTGQRVAGVVENLSWLRLPDGSTTRLFGSGGGRTVADSLSLALGTEVPLLGQVPMDPLLGEAGDAGTPLVLSAPEAPAAAALRGIAEGLTTRRRGLAGHRLPVSPS
ncbi:Mrp/NBP35 family ATP-binding protein [Streptomyces sp. NPDC003007]